MYTADLAVPFSSLNEWDQRYLGLAHFVSKWSKDPKTKVGSVITSAMNRVVSLGYNGLPPYLEDSERRLNNPEIKNQLILHAEENALEYTSRDAFNIYVYPYFTCAHCSSRIVSSRSIDRVITPYSDNASWLESFKLAAESYAEVGIDFVLVKDFPGEFRC